MMKYYSVWVASSSFKKNEPLTYCINSKLSIGTIVKVPLQKTRVMGLIVGGLDKPVFHVRSIEEVVTLHPIPEQLLKLIKWLLTYYPSSPGSILMSFLPSAKYKNNVNNIPKIPTKTPKLSIDPLTSDQRETVNSILGKPPSSTLLHGETGSGKTRIYIELARHSIKSGRSVIILTPEIGLTKQLENQFQAVFSQKVTVYHSRLTQTERNYAWQKILNSNEPIVVIGPRSALFLPLKNIGLIVMDESHETSYKHEQAPYYQTSRVASTLARLHNARFIMGSATPLVSDYYLFKVKNLPIMRITNPAKINAKPPTIETVTTNDITKFTKSLLISDPLYNSIKASLSSGEQSLIFLNRRGSARAVICQNCNWQFFCPNCDSALVFHADQHQTRCHLCGHKSPPPVSCPQCADVNIIFKSPGTKSVVKDLEKLFPKARINRFDKDNLKHERLENVYSKVQQGEVDIMVGTQLLGKGLDLPLLSTVGVVQADTSLLIPDYTADEVTYQQIVQIIGRLGRGHRDGHVVIQSNYPDSTLMRAALLRDYSLFYKSQIEYRKQFMLPPFSHVLKIIFKRRSSKSSEIAATKVKEHIDSLELPIEVTGPSPQLHEKRSEYFYWQLVIKSKERSALIEVINKLPGGCSYDIDPVRLV